MAKGLLGIIAASMIGCAYGGEAGENAADAGYEEVHDAEAPAGLPLPEECFDQRLDNNANCIDFNVLQEIKESAYKINIVTITDGESGKKENENSCSSLLLKNGLVLTAKHCIANYPLDIIFDLTGQMHEIKISLVAGGKEYGLEVLLKGKVDFALLRMKEKSDLPCFNYNAGSTEAMKEGDFVYLMGYKELPDLDARPGFVTDPDISFLNWKEGYFLVNNGIRHGDSGGPVIAFRDGVPEIIGIADFIYLPESTKGGALKIDYAMLKLLANGLGEPEIF